MEYLPCWACFRYDFDSSGVRMYISFMQIKRDSEATFYHMPYFGTSTPYLCIRNLKEEVIMWFAVIMFVCLATEVLSHLTEGEI